MILDQVKTVDMMRDFEMIRLIKSNMAGVLPCGKIVNRIYHPHCQPIVNENGKLTIRRKK